MAPMVAPGRANTPDCPSKGIIPMTMEPNPYALRSVTSNLGVVASVWAANMRAPLRRIACCSEARPGSTPGLSERNTIGRWNESATSMKRAALSAPSASIEPASTMGWLATTATGWPPSRHSEHSTARPKWGCTSNRDPASNTASTTRPMS